MGTAVGHYLTFPRTAKHNYGMEYQILAGCYLKQRQFIQFVFFLLFVFDCSATCFTRFVF